MKRVFLILAATLGLTLGGLLPMTSADAQVGFRGGVGPVNVNVGRGYYGYRGYARPYYGGYYGYQPAYRSYYYGPYSGYSYGYPRYYSGYYGYPGYSTGYYSYPSYGGQAYYYGPSAGIYIR